MFLINYCVKLSFVKFVIDIKNTNMLKSDITVAKNVLSFRV